MLNTSLCYIDDGQHYLMLHRVKKKNDVNQDKWIGIGGKFETGETPELCMLREVKEETGLTPKEWKYRGIVDFHNDVWPDERMHLFTAVCPNGELSDCDEGELEWVCKEDVFTLPIWEGDKVFFRLLEKDEPFFRLELFYSGDTLLRSVLNGCELPKE